MSSKKNETNEGAPVQAGGPFEQATTIVKSDGTALSLDQVKSATIDALKKSPKIPFTFPMSTTGHKYVDIGLNGVIYRIERGKSVQVPEPIIKIWNQSIRIEEQNAAFAGRFVQAS